MVEMDIASLSLEHQSLVNLAQHILDPQSREYAMQVLRHAVVLWIHEWWDLDILIAAGLFCHAVSYPKDDIRMLRAGDESATFAKNILKSIDRFPPEKISYVADVIAQNSFAVHVPHESLESQIIHDAIKIVSIENLYTEKAKSVFQKKQWLSALIAKEIKKKRLSPQLSWK